MADGEEELERMVRKVKEYCEEWRPEVNVSKTKVMVVAKDGEKLAKVKCKEEPECVYLSTVFSSNGKCEAEVERRQTVRAVLSSLNKQVVWNRNVSIRVKRIVFEAMLKSKLLYGGDIWWTGKRI
jgi:hypothetical protein